MHAHLPNPYLYNPCSCRQCRKQRVCHSASPAARVVFRDLFSETDLSLVEEQTVLECKAELSRELTMHDRALVFTVQAFEVVK